MGGAIVPIPSQVYLGGGANRPPLLPSVLWLFCLDKNIVSICFELCHLLSARSIWSSIPLHTTPLPTRSTPCSTTWWVPSTAKLSREHSSASPRIAPADPQITHVLPPIYWTGVKNISLGKSNVCTFNVAATWGCSWKVSWTAGGRAEPAQTEGAKTFLPQKPFNRRLRLSWYQWSPQAWGAGKKQLLGTFFLSPWNHHQPTQTQSLQVDLMKPPWGSKLHFWNTKLFKS